MKRSSGVLALSLLLCACGQLSNSPTTLDDQSIALGKQQNKAVQQPFSGTWTVTNIPEWLSLSKVTGSGDVDFTLKAKRTLGTSKTADQPTLTATLNIIWSGTGSLASGTAHWTVSADQFVITGRVRDTATLAGADLRPGSTQPLNPPLSSQSLPAADGIIVKYRSTSLRDSLLKGRATGALQEGTVKTGGVQTGAVQAQSVQSLGILEKLNLPAASRKPFGQRSVLLDVPATPANLLALQNDPNVESAIPNARFRALSLAAPVMPTDKYAPLQFAYTLMGYGAVWRDMEAGAYTRPITVAVVDTGVRFDHPDLAGKLFLPGDGALDVITVKSNGDGDGADTDPTDPNVPGRGGSHGTHVTGIIAANWGTFPAPCAACSTSGVVGASYLAPIKVLPIRALDSSGYTTIVDLANAMRYAAGLPVTLDSTTYTNPHPAQVINLSVGGSDVSAAQIQEICAAVSEAHAKGAMIFAAAGNSGATAPYYPAACTDAVSVASVTLSGSSAPEHAYYSNHYAQVQLSAPGGSGGLTFYNGNTFNGSAFADDIISTGWNYGTNTPIYETESGTSQASPQAAALAALMLSKGVTSGPADTLARMNATATDLGAKGRDPFFGYGMINAAAALNAPAVSDTLGLRLQDADGKAYQPVLDPLGRFTAYLGDGTYQVVAGRDRNQNGIYGESSEPREERTVALGESNPNVDLGELSPQN